jgi:hypothetical protein
MNISCQSTISLLRRVCIGLCVLAVSGCVKFDPPSSSGYADDLIDAIQSADRIVVSEHTDRNDVHSEEEEATYKEVTFATRELSPAQRGEFVSILKGLAPEIQDAFPACVFNPHHTIRFYRGGKLKSAVEICFGCGQVEWDGTGKTPPWALYAGLNQFVSSIGLRTKADWHAAAKDAGAIK